jgi:hypothetical protein
VLYTQSIGNPQALTSCATSTISGISGIRGIVLLVVKKAGNLNTNDDGGHAENDKKDEETDPSFSAGSPSGYHCFVRIL